MISTEVKQTLATWTDVRANMLNWYNDRSIILNLKNLFKGTPSFQFNSPAQSGPKTLHFYPAVNTSNELVMYIINGNDDKLSVFEKTSPDQFVQDYVTIAPIIQSPPSNSPAFPDENVLSQIHADEALQRIRNWDVYHNTWIEVEVPKDGIFQAFTLTASDQGLQGDLMGYFGLDGTANPFNFTADLILLNTENNFYNTVRPVPPFPSGEEFFMLDAAVGLP